MKIGETEENVGEDGDGEDDDKKEKGEETPGDDPREKKRLKISDDDGYIWVYGDGEEDPQKKNSGREEVNPQKKDSEDPQKKNSGGEEENPQKKDSDDEEEKPGKKDSVDSTEDFWVYQEKCPEIPGHRRITTIYPAEPDDFEGFLIADFVVYGGGNTPSLVVEQEPPPQRVPITVVAMNNKQTDGSGLLFIYRQPGPKTSLGVSVASLKRYTSSDSIDIVMRNGVAGLTDFSLDYPWEAFRWGHEGLKRLLESILTQDECLRYQREYAIADYQHSFFMKMCITHIFGYLMTKGIVHTATNNDERSLTKLSWCSDTSDGSRDKQLLGLKEAVAKVGVGLWGMLQEETNLQHPSTYKRWANTGGSRDLREYLGIKVQGKEGIDDTGEVHFGFESVELTLYIVESEDDLRWDDSCNHHQDFETSVLLLFHIVYEWGDDDDPQCNLAHLVLRFNAGGNV